MLLSRVLITGRVIELISSWAHTGFGVYLRKEDNLGIYEFGKKRAPPRIEDASDEFDEYIRDDYIDCDHVC